MEHQPAKALPVQLPVTPELGDQRWWHRHPAALRHVSILERPPLRVLIGVKPALRRRAVSAPHDQPPCLVANGQLDVIPTHAGHLTPVQPT